MTRKANLAETKPTLHSHRKHANLLGCVPAVNHFITSALRTGRVLVHCSFGRSRSAAFISAFLIQERGYTLHVALKLLKHKRPVVDVNEGFVRQLGAFEAAAGDTHVANQMWQWGRAAAPQAVDAGHSHIVAAMTLQTPDLHAPLSLPPTLSLDTEFVCRGCQTSLFHSSDVLVGDRAPSDGPGPAGPLDMSDSGQEVMEQQQQEKEAAEEEEEVKDGEDTTVVVRLRSDDDIDLHLLGSGAPSVPCTPRARSKARRARGAKIRTSSSPTLPRFRRKSMECTPGPGAQAALQQARDAIKTAAAATAAAASGPLPVPRILRHRSSYAMPTPKAGPVLRRPELTKRSSSHDTSSSVQKPDVKIPKTHNNNHSESEGFWAADSPLGEFLQRDKSRAKQVLGGAHLRLSGMLNWIHAKTREAAAPAGDLCCPQCDSTLGTFDLKHAVKAGAPPVRIVADTVVALPPRVL